MKILMIAPQPFFEPRGTPFSVLNRLHALSELGHKIDLLTYPIGQDIKIENVKIYRTLRIPFIRHIDVGPSKTKILLDIFIVLKAIRLLLKYPYDVIHSHEEAGFFSTWLSKLFGLKHLYDMHSSLPQQLSNFKFTRSGFIINYFNKLEKKTINNADAVITICPELFDYVERLYPGKNHVLIENVAGNDLVFGDNKETALDILDRYQLKTNLIILYAGTFEPYQGLKLLINSAAEVIEHYNEVTFVLVGGNPKQVDEYKAIVDEKHLGNNFVFTGQVWPDLVPKFINLSDILVTPRTDGNNTPLKIYSYLRSDRPIVATRHITHTQVLNDDVAVLTECEAGAFAEGIIRLIKDKELRRILAGRAKKLAEEKYSYASYLNKTKKVYCMLERKQDKGLELN